MPRMPVSMPLRMLALLFLPAMLTACATDGIKTLTTAPGNKPLVCSQWLPISYSWPGDTETTVKQIRSNNVRERGYCAAVH